MRQQAKAGDTYRILQFYHNWLLYRPPMVLTIRLHLLGISLMRLRICACEFAPANFRVAGGFRRQLAIIGCIDIS
jgi:hypothetical protein